MSNPRHFRSGRLRSRLAWAALVATTVFACSNVVVADQADDDYDVAVGHYRKQRWKDASAAMRSFLKAHKTDRRVPFVRFYLGISLENQEQYKEARVALRGFVKDYPKNKLKPDALFRVAECSYFLNELKTAETEFQAFLKADAKHAFAEFALPYIGDVQFRLKKPKQAAANFELALTRYKDGRMADDARFGLAHCYADLKRPDDALKLYRELAAKGGSSFAPDAQLEAGSLLFKLKRFAESAKAYDEFDTKFPKSTKRFRARLNAGFSYFRQSEFRKAIQRFQSAAESKPLLPEAAYWQGVAYRQLKDYEKAAAVLKAEFERDAKSPLAADVLFQWAAAERLQEHYATAGKLYLDYVKRWPKNADADDALHFAGEMALLDNKPAEAQKLVDRFRREYPDSDLWAYRDLLQARIDTVGNDKAKHKAAAELLEGVIRRSKIDQTRSLARFHLARTYRLLKDHKQALKAVAPLVAEIKKSGKPTEFVDALLYAAASQLAEKQYQPAVDSATLYLKLTSAAATRTLPASGSHWALSTRAEAYFELASGPARSPAPTGDISKALADLDTLSKDFAKDPLTAQTINRIAEAAYKRKKWDWSAALFTKLAALGKQSRYYAAALSGLGWSQFEQKEYRKAADAFASLQKDHPNDALVPQAGYKEAECEEKLNKLDAAAEKYLAVFNKFAPKEPAKPGDEKLNGKHYYTYHAGLNAARVLGKQNGKTKEADAAYEKLFKLFPKPEQLDLRLDEWALLNYNAKNYKRADEIFRRLIRDVPNSPLVDNARYTLAESDLNAGRLEPAKKVFAELHASPKSDATVKEVSLYRLIGIAIEQEQWTDARKLAAAFRSEFPKSDHRWYAAFSEAEARFSQRDYAGAKKLLAALKTEKADSIAAKSPWFPRVWLIDAEIAVHQRDYDAVEKTFADAKKRFAKWPQAYLFDEILGRAYKQQAKFKEAREAFGRVIAHPKSRRTATAAKCQALIADTYFMQDNYKAARLEYFKVDTLYAFPEYQAPALLLAGHCEEKLGDFKAAAKTFQDLIKRFPNTKEAKQAKPRLAAALKKAAKNR
jgi:TolA-binding protein